jgi:hypothetical protein
MSQGAIDEDADAMLPSEREDARFDVATEQVIRRLEGIDRANLLERRHLAGVVVRDADEPDLALADELVERLRGCADRRGRVGPVDLVDVNVVGAEGSEAGFEVAAQSCRAAVADGLAAVLAKAALCGDHDRLAGRSDLRSQRLPQELLRGAEPVGVGGVEQRDSEVERLARRCDCRTAVDAAPVAARRPVAEGDP